MRQETRPSRRRFRPALDALEGRDVPAAFGIPWADPQHLTLSFLPDGTPIAGHTSTLSQTLDPQMPTASWQREILRAFQTWAVNSNINIGLTADSGAPLGTAGMPQRDPRFGDIRVGAQAMAPEALAITVPYSPAFTGTWSGDVLINSSDVFNSQTKSLLGVALHEAGHAFGIGDSTDPNSPMYSSLSNVTKLTSADITALRNLYGSRGPDFYEGSSGNDSMGKATTLSFPGSYKGATPLVVFGDVSSNSDVDEYAVRPPSGYRGAITFRLQSSGVSLLTPKLTLLDSRGNVLGAALATSDFGDTVTLHLNSSDPNATYYLRVEGATKDVFGIGGYGLAVNFDGTSKVTPAALDAFIRSSPGTLNADEVAAAFQNPSQTLIHDDRHADDTEISAVRLDSTPGFASHSHYEVVASLSSPTDVDYYRIDGPGGNRNVLTASLRSVVPNGVVPRATILDSDGHLVASRILANGDGLFTVQAVGVKTSGHYFVKVDGDGTAASVGNYGLDVNFGSVATNLTSFASGSIGTTGQQSYDLYVAQSQLFQFLLTTPAATAPAGSNVQMTITDSSGKVVFSLSGGVGQTVSGKTLFLIPGAYKVLFSAVSGSGGPPPALSFQLNGDSISDPVGPAVSDPTLTPIYIPPTKPAPGQPPVYQYPTGILSPTPYLMLAAR